MAWVVLLFAGLLEIVWAYFMKLSEGFTKLIPTVLTLFFVLLSFFLLSYAMKTLPLGTAYTIWAGIGVVGSFVVGVLVLGESASPIRIIAALLIVTGLILMKVSTD
ncbi:multidrug transporter (plasmid) [Acinetobacter sp. NCu2D-2]|uniref:SMR family transporter n=1 Tax=Acinetobacter sp. NCu2D-2 TaxID=1608473 RepID=UPI0007CDB826|nr:SMR family transporter [Acinetobacter sp. NCu2D-2]ANF83407.1 multidrug transporter [Acinetobacter sp. NCu2D-2]